MPNKLKALILEDTEDDLQLLLMHLNNGGYDVEYTCIQTEDDYRDALEKSSWEIILSDYSMPDFNGLKALQIIKNSEKDIPFILISGKIGEELAVQLMRAGAADYFIKGNLQRLIPSIEKELNDVKRRKQYQIVENQRRRLLKVVQQSINEIYIFSSDTLLFEYANETALKNLGYNLGELKNLTPTDLKKGFHRESFNKLLNPLRSKEKDKIILNTHHTRSDGSKYPVEVHIQQIQEQTQSFFVAVALDVTLREKSAQIIKEQKLQTEELELSSRYKSEFLANMSHELRTPLNSIILLSKLLKGDRFDNLNEDQIDYLNVIYGSGNKLLDLINDVLDLSKIEAGEISFYIDKILAEQIFNNLVKSFDAVADEKGIRFIHEFDLNKNQFLKTDQLRLEQVLTNFLSNAFKFTMEGSVEFRAYLPGSNEKKELNINESEIIAFSVKDTGIGIGKNKRDLIFEAFRQADSSNKRSFGGSGLGLSISKEISDLLGGEIKLKSRLNRGSTFTIYLPIDSSLFISDKKNRTIGDKKAVSIFRNLVVEDQIDNVKFGTKPNFTKDKINSNSAAILIVDDSEIHVSALKELIENKQ
ncbi:MAG: ATP-binding protein, partial [Candidatus Paceibacterota bacterium]